ncbi:MAG: hypothetical protein C5B49_01900 [Bdellovibrio sp.]|nr:MAG: hypothetical protein C5B49_01900 [Bdellovibrio sp.]
MDLKDRAQQVLERDFPGLILAEAKLRAEEIALIALEKIRSIEKRIADLEHAGHLLKSDYKDAVRAANLFENALIDEGGE